VFTEKTLYALLALNFPIWIGGWGHADQFRQMGFDVFDDIVNHSYQYKPTLFERCYSAFDDNSALLTDLKYVSQLRNQCRDRLENNRNLLFRGQLEKTTHTAMATWPQDLQQTITEIFNLERAKYLNTLPG
jgi:hypothetical protein